MMARRKKGRVKRALKEVVSMSFFLLFVLILTYFVLLYVGQRTEVVGSSMEYTLLDGDHLIVDKLSYRLSDPKRFDIIVFPYQQSDTFFIKRIIGMPGETVEIRDGVIYINDSPLIESYGREVTAFPGRAEKPVKLGRNEYFVMGDNRNDSTDSRDAGVGNIARKDIVGKAWIRIWPFSRIGILRHQ